jgi:hypothetical protein
MKIIIIAYNIYRYLKNMFTNNLNIFDLGQDAHWLKKLQMYILRTHLPSKHDDHFMLGE